MLAHIHIALHAPTNQLRQRKTKTTMSIVLQKPVVYQLAVRYFGNTNLTNQWGAEIGVNGCGKFSDINVAAIRALHQFGVTHIWLTGCLRQTTLTSYPGLPADDPDIVKGRAGSFYAIRDYFDVCPDYANDPLTRMSEFEDLINRLHASGLKVLIDLVPNHVARSYGSIVKPELDFGTSDDQTRFFDAQNCFFHLVQPPGQPLVLRHPSYWQPAGVTLDGRFAQEDGGPGRTCKATADASKYNTTPSPDPSGWYDGVKLNYGFNYVDESSSFVPIPRTWSIVDQIIEYWQKKGVDGFRCDMAHLIPKEAWSYLIGRARQPSRDPNAYFLAEAYVGIGSHDPVKTIDELLDAGFDSVYHDESYNELRGIYTGTGSQDVYDAEMRSLSVRERSAAVDYLENHDKPRVAAPIPAGGFGSLEANFQLAPLQFLYSSGPALMFNGQEVGEPGAGFEGFDQDNGHTTFFDYWGMPALEGWVHGHAYDGAGLSSQQLSLRNFFRDLLQLCQDISVRSSGYWGLKYFNRNSRFADCPDDLYSFARFEPGANQVLVVVANFRPGNSISGQIRIPAELVNAASLTANPTVRLVLNKAGAQNLVVGSIFIGDLSITGFHITLADQETHVYLIG